MARQRQTFIAETSGSETMTRHSKATGAFLGTLLLAGGLNLGLGAKGQASAEREPLGLHGGGASAGSPWASRRSRGALARLLAMKPDLSAKTIRQAFPWSDPDQEAHFLEGLVMAGLQ